MGANRLISRKIMRSFESQKMFDVPTDRIATETFFKSYGIDWILSRKTVYFTPCTRSDIMYVYWEIKRKHPFYPCNYVATVSLHGYRYQRCKLK